MWIRISLIWTPLIDLVNCNFCRFYISFPWFWLPGSESTSLIICIKNKNIHLKSLISFLAHSGFSSGFLPRARWVSRSRYRSFIFIYLFTIWINNFFSFMVSDNLTSGLCCQNLYTTLFLYAKYIVLHIVCHARTQFI